MTAYQIDSEDIEPQPTGHEWEPPDIAGYDGDGVPIYARYRTVTLENELLLCAQDWIQYADGVTHSIYLPSPGTVDNFTTYNNVYIDEVSSGEIQRQRGLNSTSMRVIRVVV